MSAPGGGGGGLDPPGPTHDAVEHPRGGRGLLLVVVAVVVGVLLLPSATRAPLVATANTTGTSTTTSTPATAGGHGAHHGTTTTTSLPPASIHVLVANATTTNGVAGAVTAYLATKGFATLTATNALLKVTASEIYAVGGATADVAPVAAALNLPSSSVEPTAASAPVASSTGANVVVVVGPDLASRFHPGATTTAAG